MPCRRPKAARKEIERQESKGQQPSFKRILTAVGVDRANGEVWVALNNRLLHFDKKATAAPPIRSTRHKARARSNTILVRAGPSDYLEATAGHLRLRTARQKKYEIDQFSSGGFRGALRIVRADVKFVHKCRQNQHQPGRIAQLCAVEKLCMGCESRCMPSPIFSCPPRSNQRQSRADS